MSRRSYGDDGGGSPADDVEKNAVAEIQQQQHASKSSNAGGRGIIDLLAVEDGVVYKSDVEGRPKWLQLILDAGVEENGIKPVPVEKRTNTQYNNLFTVFFTGLLCILPIPTGMLATTVFELSLRDASLTILFFSALCTAIPAFMGCGGYKTGLRQMIQARYSWGLYLVVIPLVLNAATVTGFSIVAAIVSGQTIAAINPGNVSVTVGIVIVIIGSFVLTLLGYKVLHIWERYQWLPNLIALVIMTGVGGKRLASQQEVPPATAPQVLSYGGLIAGYFITFGGTASDFSIYHDPKAPLFKIFSYVYLGMFTPSVPLLILGAAMGGSVPVVDGWADAYNDFGAGGIMAEMLKPAGGFGKFILVLLALSVVGNIGISMYPVALNIQMLVPVFTKVPRFLFSLVVTAIMIPLSIVASTVFEASLENFLAVIGYWAGFFDAVLIMEAVVFRRLDWETFDQSIWNVGRKLPTGIAALLASLFALAFVIPGIDEVWFVGPFAKTTGDIGFELAFVGSALFYLPLRWLEIRWRGHL
ncbi:NCS1 nucleoside transporter [Xylariaceae sp. FL0255]|nr:NCS1 nucleoside transporter [Xylariaceae sp. FL0255]